MTSWMHQMMSQQEQVVETTPGQSQKLFKTSETVNLTEKIQRLSTRSQDATMMEKDSFLGSLLVLPVEVWKGIAR